jgi:hypothetical protein
VDFVPEGLEFVAEAARQALADLGASGRGVWIAVGEAFAEDVEKGHKHFTRDGDDGFLWSEAGA